MENLYQMEKEQRVQQGGVKRDVHRVNAEPMRQMARKVADHDASALPVRAANARVMGVASVRQGKGATVVGSAVGMAAEAARETAEVGGRETAKSGSRANRSLTSNPCHHHRRRQCRKVRIRKNLRCWVSVQRC
jgi:hypothetical protein